MGIQIIMCNSIVLALHLFIFIFFGMGRLSFPAHCAHILKNKTNMLFVLGNPNYAKVL